MPTNYTYLNEISASDGFYALDNTPPVISILYNVPSTKISNSYISVYANVYDVGGIESSGISLDGPTTQITNFLKTGNNYTFTFDVTGTGTVVISAVDIAGNSSVFAEAGYIISAVNVDTIPPIITFSNSYPLDKKLTSASMGSIHVRVTDNYSIAASQNNFILTPESIGTIDYSSLSAIDARTVEFDIINIVESGYVIVSAIDDARNVTIASDGLWVSICPDGKKINITDFLPSHLRESETYDLMKFFEDFLNSMYYDKNSKCNISILEKINKLKDFNDINQLDSDYFQFFANHFGYEVDINKESIGVFSTSNSDEDINEYIRLSLKNLPNFNRLKSSEDAISIMLFSFGVVADILYMWTNDYDENWASESRYNNINVKNEIPNNGSASYYPTPHFKISVNYTQTPPEWVANFNKIIDLVNNIRPVNTVFKEFSGYFETVKQNPNDPLALGYAMTVSVLGKVVIPWIGPPASHGTSFDYIDEAEISLMTADSTGLQTYQLTALNSNDHDITEYCTWTSSNESAITVSNGGLLTCVGAGAATITATNEGISKTMVVTGYATMPDVAGLRTLKGGKTTATSFTMLTTFTQVLATSDHKAALFIGTSSRVAGGLGPVTRTYFLGADTTYFDMGDTNGAIGLNHRSTDGSAAFTRSTRKTISGTIPTGSFDFDVFSNGGTTVELNGASIGTTFDVSVSGTGNGALVGDFTTGRASGLVLMAVADSSKTRAQMTPANCTFWHCFKCYIRKTNTPSRTNYTIIPNLGTLGNTYNLAANNVPAGWFAV